ncbi:MAG: hypothetical protein LH491_01980 [Pseudoxanthomonas sp.]|nr:hypothetical protein [Pseudoxanthomonas sp.]
MSRSRPALGLLALLAIAGCQQMPVRDASDAAPVTDCSAAATAPAAEAFYRQIVELNTRGLPSMTELVTLGPLMSFGLQASIERARGRQQAMMIARPQDKPDFIEGSLFTSLFEGPTRVLAATPADAVQPALVAVSLEYAQDETVRWQDRLLLLCEGGRWRVEDVRFGGDWDFANRGSLRQALDAE